MWKLIERAYRSSTAKIKLDILQHFFDHDGITVKNIPFGHSTASQPKLLLQPCILTLSYPPRLQFSHQPVLDFLVNFLVHLW